MLLSYPGLANGVLPVSHIRFNFIKNSAIAGAQRKKSRLDLEVSLSFDDFWSRACAKMDLDPNDAELGWKFEGQLKGDLCNELGSADDLEDLFEKAIQKEKRKHTRDVEVNMHNLVRVLLMSCPLN